MIYTITVNDEEKEQYLKDFLLDNDIKFTEKEELVCTCPEEGSEDETDDMVVCPVHSF